MLICPPYDIRFADRLELSSKPSSTSSSERESPVLPPSRIPPPSAPTLLESSTIDIQQTSEEPATATGVHGETSRDVNTGLRDEDRAFCRTHFAGRVTSNSIDALVERMGGRSLLERYHDLKHVAAKSLDSPTPTFLSSVATSYAKESLLVLPPLPELEVDGRYWPAALADLAVDSSSSPPAYHLNYFSTGGTYLPTTSKFKKQRKPDACLRPAAASRATIHNVAVGLEFTAYNAPSHDHNPLDGGLKQHQKLRQAVVNAADLKLHQAARLFVPSISIHGEFHRATLFFSVLDSMVWEYVAVEKCFDLVNLPSLAALLHLLRTASLYELGLNPLIEYSFTKVEKDFERGDPVPVAIDLPQTLRINVDATPISPLPTSPFSRSTVVFAGQDERIVDGQPRRTIAKFALIADERSWRERTAYETWGSSPPPFCPRLLHSLASPPLRTSPVEPVVDSNAGAKGKNSKKRSAPRLDRVTLRHLEVYVFDSLSGAAPLDRVPTIEDFLSLAKQLFQTVGKNYEAGLLHRDLSLNNVLALSAMLVLIDWELARRIGDEASSIAGVVTGTLDTMAVGYLLRSSPARPHDELESAIYVLFKAFTTSFVPSEDMKSQWHTDLNGLRWNQSLEPKVLASVRETMWGDKASSPVVPILNHLRAQGAGDMADVFETLFHLELPLQSKARAALTLETAENELEVLIKDAVRAVNAARSLSGSWPVRGKSEDKNIVRDLVELLREAKQEVPGWLEAVMREGGGFGGRGRGRGGGRGGNRDVRTSRPSGGGGGWGAAPSAGGGYGGGSYGGPPRMSGGPGAYAYGGSSGGSYSQQSAWY
ncbi:Pkinase-fungal domain-containing protein [Pseudohyphozyma bogoriensis]|nr:Pkinase-fungal domain-containing protein [Pseudohyphozyma bogoriensis]